MQFEYKSQPLRQNWDKELPRYWFDNSPFKTHFFNAVSILVPPAENVVVHAIKHNRVLLTDPVLKAQTAEMVAQENWHSFSHRQYNAWLTRIGLPAPELGAWFLQKMIKAKNKLDKFVGPKGWLTAVICGEHNAAVMMEYFLERPRILAQMHPHFRQAWVWHFIEEIEHKGSSMDMWHELKDVYNYKRYMLQIAFALFIIRFKINHSKMVIALLKHDKQLWKWRTVKDAWSFLLGADGLTVKTFVPILKFFKPNFHPCDHDTRYLLEQYAKITEEEHLSPAQVQQIDADFQGCISDIEAAIEANNIKKY